MKPYKKTLLIKEVLLFFGIISSSSAPKIKSRKEQKLTIYESKIRFFYNPNVVKML